MSEMDNEREPVAYRWMWPETNQWHYADYNLHPECDTVEPLYNATPDKLALAVEALEPFSKAFLGLSSRWEDHETHWQDSGAVIRVKDLRMAALALAAIKAYT